ncbi:ArsR/SmtB family transcription factor [Rothia kristinae]|uniref:ArsR/SmtB family transcription factor n=1 Tax=Rothia kristinae TaxID=37923 RepID=UPI0022B7D096|nr:metalloregulator ArsR/SmtB family transcription factor [Rothia kristinae]
MSTDVFSVIADPTRRRILRAVQGQARPVNGIVTELGVSQPTVSKHLKVLREAGLVSVRAEGQRRLYSLLPEPLEPVRQWLEELIAAGEDAPAEQTAPEQETTGLGTAGRSAAEKAAAGEALAEQADAAAPAVGAGAQADQAQGPESQRSTPQERPAGASAPAAGVVQHRPAHRRTPRRFQPLTPLPATTQPAAPPTPEPFDLEAALAQASAPSHPVEGAPTDAEPALPSVERDIAPDVAPADVAPADVESAAAPAAIEPDRPEPPQEPAPADTDPSGPVEAVDPLARRTSSEPADAGQSGFLATLFGRKRGR